MDTVPFLKKTVQMDKGCDHGLTLTKYFVMQAVCIGLVCCPHHPLHAHQGHHVGRDQKEDY